MSCKDTFSLINVLRTLLLCSEKAATLARSVRMQYELFENLVQRKRGPDANERFSVDVKTLADVLIQEVIRHDLDSAFPGFGSHVFGEESNTFRTVSGERLVLKIPDTSEKLTVLLARVLDNNASVARKLSETALLPLNSFCVYPGIYDQLAELEKTDTNAPSTKCDWSNYGVWIDPIDATAQYVRGRWPKDIVLADAVTPPSVGTLNACSTYQLPGSLVNVTVLIGLFERANGRPVAGVMNQPFYQRSLLSRTSNAEVGNFANSTQSDIFGRSYWSFNSPNGCNTSTLSAVCCEKLPDPEQESQSEASHRALRSPDHLCRSIPSDAANPGGGAGDDGLRIACSTTEFPRLCDLFQTNNSDLNSILHGQKILLISSPGAGFKLLSLILNAVDAYVLYRPFTHVWDTCAPHAFLRALGGGVIRLIDALDAVGHLLSQHCDSSTGKSEVNLETAVQGILDDYEIFYPDKAESTDNMAAYRNTGGLLAYRDPQLASRLLIHLAQQKDDPHAQ